MAKSKAQAQQLNKSVLLASLLSNFYSTFSFLFQTILLPETNFFLYLLTGDMVCVRCETAAMRDSRTESPRCPGHGVEGRTTRWEALSAPHCRGKWVRIEAQLLDTATDENAKCELCANGSQFIFV